MKCTNNISHYHQQQLEPRAKPQPKHITMTTIGSGTDDDNKKTSFNPSNYIYNNGPVKNHCCNHPDWDTVTRNLNQETKMELICGKKRL